MLKIILELEFNQVDYLSLQLKQKPKIPNFFMIFKMGGESFVLAVGIKL